METQKWLVRNRQLLDFPDLLTHLGPATSDQQTLIAQIRITKMVGNILVCLVHHHPHGSIWLNMALSVA